MRLVQVCLSNTGRVLESLPMCSGALGHQCYNISGSTHVCMYVPGMNVSPSHVQ